MNITNEKIGLGIPCNFPMIHTAAFDSFMLLEAVPNIPFVYLRANNGYIDELRNQLVEKALTIGCTKLIMMDADMIYPHDTIQRLYSRNLDVVSALIWKRYPPFDSLMYVGEPGNYRRIENWDDGELVEVDATGTGCIMYNCEIFKKIPPPWFEFTKTSNGDIIGEDISFCIKLKKYGYKIFVDTSVKTMHLTTFAVTEKAHRLFMKLHELGYNAKESLQEAG